MAACIEAHDIPGNIAAPRLRVTRTYEISAPVACHHCEDAPCAKACPTGALFFDPKNHRIGVNEDNCIGCNQCSPHCPQGIDIPRELHRISDYVERLRRNKP